MMWKVLVAAFGQLAIGCDPTTTLSASAITASRVEQSCILEILRAETIVTEARVDAYGQIVAAMGVPDDVMGEIREPHFGIQERLTDDGRYELRFVIAWTTRAETAEYYAYVQDVLDDLLGTTIEVCADG